MTNERKEYLRLRAKGWSAGDALRAARTNARFALLESAGVARMRIEPDDAPYNPGDLDDVESVKRARVEGVWGFVCEIKNPYRSDLWERVDSVWGFVGNDWQDSGYDVEARASAIETLKTLEASAIERRAAQVRALSRDALESLALDVAQALHPDGIAQDSDAWDAHTLDAVHNTLDVHGLVP